MCDSLPLTSRKYIEVISFLILTQGVLFSFSHTSAGADVVILAGDLNMHPTDLGIRLLQSYTGLKDCFNETANFDVSTETVLIWNIEAYDKCIAMSKQFTITGLCLLTLQGCVQGFTHITDNPFTHKQGLVPFGGGIRIDYVFFKVNVLLFAVGQKGLFFTSFLLLNAL